MKPAQFVYHAPETLAEAMTLIHDLGPEAKIISGGQSLVSLMNFRMVTPSHLVDLKRVPGLLGIVVGDSTIRVGARVTHLELERSTALREVCPLLPTAAALIGHAAIRSRGTIGGSLVHADPSAEWPMVAIALQATLHLESLTGKRQVAAQDFFAGYLTSAIEPGEILVAVEFPLPPIGSGWAIQEFSRRAGDFAVVAAAGVVTIGAAGRWQRIRLAVAGAGAVPVDLSIELTEALCTGRPTSGEMVEQAAGLVAAELEPMGDLHGSAEYRRSMVATLVGRVLLEAESRARGEAAL